MSAEGQNKMAKRRVHPKKTKPADKAAVSVANANSRKTGRELPQERRLQELNNAMEKFDNQGADEDSGNATEDIDGLPCRHRSDDGDDER